MRKQTIISLILSGVIALSYAFAVINPQLAGTQRVRAQGTSGSGQYASVNGLKIYYKVSGAGQPLLLLHGGLGGTYEFGQLLPLLAKNRKVIAIELQGHGRPDEAAMHEAWVNAYAAELRQGNSDVY